MADPRGQGKPSFLRSPTGIALLVFIGIAAFLLVAEHRAHALGVLPYLILLACPLIHVFMHRGHGGHGGNGGHAGHQAVHPVADNAPSPEDNATGSRPTVDRTESGGPTP